MLIHADSRDEVSTVFGGSRTCCGERKDYLLYCTVEDLEIPGKLKWKGKAIPKQAWTGPDVSRNLRLPDFKTISCKVVSRRHWPPVPPKKYAWYSFLSEAKSTPGP
jgi:hypothetical protein